jgi:hypothetical protein
VTGKVKGIVPWGGSRETEADAVVSDRASLADSAAAPAEPAETGDARYGAASSPQSGANQQPANSPWYQRFWR